MLVIAIQFYYLAEDAKKKYTNPGQCTMYDHGCQKMMILWTVGYYGTCFGAEYGLKIGPNGFKCAVIEVRDDFGILHLYCFIQSNSSFCDNTLNKRCTEPNEKI